MWREPDSPQSGTENTEIETIINPSVSSVPSVVNFENTLTIFHGARS
jgi:hypothetical protein